MTVSRVHLADIAALLVALMVLWWSPHHPGNGSSVTSLVLLVGMIFIVGTMAGQVAKRCGLPRISGSIFAGVLANVLLLESWPTVGAVVFVDQAHIRDARPINDLTIGLIALMAGAKIRLSWLRARLRAILTITAVSILVVPGVIMSVLLIAPSIPGLGQSPFMAMAISHGIPGWSVAALAGLILVTNSPTVVVSVIKELRADGPMTQTVMGVSVVMDAVVIVLFTVLVALIALLGNTTEVSLGWAVGNVTGSIMWSMVIGLFFGFGLQHFTERSDRSVHVIVMALMALLLAVAFLAPYLHIKPLFCLLAVGFACENLVGGRTAQGFQRLDSAIVRIAQPIFVVFFVVAGLSLSMAALQQSWMIVVVLTAVRFISVWCSVRCGSWLGRADESVTKYGYIGMLSQAGVTLALGAMVAQRFPGWGESLATVIIAMVAVHEIICPAAFAWAIRRTGEAKAEQAEHAEKIAADRTPCP